MHNYLVYTGNFYPHKNVSLLIEASLSTGLELYLFGEKTPFFDRLPKSDLVHLKPGLSDREIISFYKYSLCFVMPSFHEGMGLPGIEAMSVGCPVLSSNASCLPEVYGDAALYFDPKDVNSLVNQINKLKSDPSLRQECVSKGLAQSQKYSWSKMSEQTWQIYQSVLQ